MANDQLPNDVIRTWTGALDNLDAAGNPVPNPGATFSVVVVPPVVNIVINGSDVTANATGPNTVGIVATFSETGGAPEASFDWTFDTVDDLTPRQVRFNSAAAFTDVTQPVPPQTP